MSSKSFPSTSRPSPISNHVPCNESQPIIDINDSDEDSPSIPPVTSPAHSPQVGSNAKAKKKCLCMLIIEVDSEENSSPQSISEYESWDKDRRKTYRKQMARVAGNALEEKDWEKQLEKIAKGSYADDGTIGMISNLSISDKDNRSYHKQPERPSSNQTSAPKLSPTKRSPSKAQQQSIMIPEQTSGASSSRSTAYISPPSTPHRHSSAVLPGESPFPPLSIPHQQYFANPRFGSPSTSKKNYYVLFVGVNPGIYGNWHIVNTLIRQTTFKIYRGYATLREAKQVWALANGIGSARALNTSGQVIGVPPGPFPQLEDNDYEDADWFTVIIGRFPGIYPVWNFDPTQVLRTSANGSMVTKHASRALAEQEFDDAARAGLVRSIEIVF
ncbi:hypothetical protein HWV62_11946 [Athelia sp. TMB]|nr:hypothetical protein HWV62_11946 [Athelia sp. TMB]